jgi:EpsI family protein
MHSIPTKKNITVVVIFIISTVLIYYLKQSENIQPKKPFSSFPIQIGEWNGEISYFDNKVYEVLGVDDSILSNYKNSKGDNVQLYVGFHQSQKEGDLIHSPQNCMPGSGWNITNVELEDVKIPTEKTGKIITIKLTLEKGNMKQLVLYWFQSRGRIISSEYLQKIYLVIDSIFKHRTDGSFVRLISPIINNNEEASLKTLKEFTKLAGFYKLSLKKGHRHQDYYSLANFIIFSS